MTVPLPLAGVRVLDLSRVLAGPYCTMMLADLGADVIKLERPGLGDPTRAWGPPFAEGESAYYLCVNRGKRSVALDLADTEGLAVARELARRSDIVVESFLPGGAAKLGLGYEELSASTPGIVYGSISGYPADHPAAARPGFDFAIQAEGGIMSVTGEPDGAPMKVGVAITDITAGMFCAIGLLAALRQREQTGRGRHVEVSLFDAQLAWLANRGSEVLIADEVPERLGNAHPTIVPYEAFATGDAKWVIVAIGTDEQFQRFCREAEATELAEDERFRTNPQRVAHRREIVAHLAALIGRRPLAEWLEVIARSRVPGGAVRTIPEVFGAAPFAIATHDHPTIGPVQTVRSAIGLDGTHPTAQAAPPLLGEHTAEVLCELGYDAERVGRLMAGPCAS